MTALQGREDPGGHPALISIGQTSTQVSHTSTTSNGDRISYAYTERYTTEMGSGRTHGY